MLCRQNDGKAIKFNLFTFETSSKSCHMILITILTYNFYINFSSTQTITLKAACKIQELKRYNNNNFGLRK